MTVALHFLSALFMLGVLWVAGGIVLLSPAPDDRPAIIPKKYIGWWIVGYWAVIVAWVLIAELAG